MNNQEFMNVAALQKVLGICRGQAYELVNREDFPSLRVGKRIVIPVRQFEAWVEKQTAKA